MLPANATRVSDQAARICQQATRIIELEGRNAVLEESVSTLREQASASAVREDTLVEERAALETTLEEERRGGGLPTDLRPARPGIGRRAAISPGQDSDFGGRRRRVPSLLRGARGGQQRKACRCRRQRANVRRGHCQLKDRARSSGGKQCGVRFTLR